MWVLDVSDLTIPFASTNVRRGRDALLTPYATKPPNIPAHPLNEYQMRARKGTSFWAYQIDVSRVRPGVTIASRSPRKNLMVFVHKSPPSAADEPNILTGWPWCQQSLCMPEY